MALYITSLNSGSNGNCYYVGNDTEAVLIDVGISCRETEKRMKRLDLSMKKIKAIFISHEHGDHIKGVATLAHKYSLPVFITRQTAKHGPGLISHLSKNFEANTPITIGKLTITAFSKQHDAIDPHSFIISCDGITVGVFTDIGTACDNTIEYFKQCHAVFLESNYDEDLLENGKYPAHLKKRISSDVGHLSNRQALELFNNHRSEFLTHILLSHLSKENNSPEIAKSLFEQHANGVHIIVASRDQESPVFKITGAIGDTKNVNSIALKPVQLGLFGNNENFS